MRRTEKGIGGKGEYKMKTYFNKLYTIEGAAKRSGITDGDILFMINKKVVGTIKRFGITMLKGKVVNSLAKIYEQNKVKSFKKEQGK